MVRPFIMISLISCFSKKGNKLNSELGLKLKKEPIEPSPTPVSALIREAKHHTWKHFLTI